MIKAASGNTAILGLSDENIKRLQEGKPISLNLKDLGLADIDVIIFSGKDEDSMKKDLQPFLRRPH